LRLRNQFATNNSIQEEKMATNNQPGAAVASAPATNDNGQNAMFALWLLISTNPAFLLGPAADARSAGTVDVTLTPGTGDGIDSWDTLTGKLQANNNNGDLFQRRRVEMFLTNFLTKPLAGDRFSSDKTYAAVLQNACAIFQEAKTLFVPGWEPPCPHTMDQIPGLKS
jgi:hypothetical protein